MTSDGAPDGAAPAEWDGVFDEAFVRGGRRELSAAQRAERNARIAAGHARLLGSSDVPLLVPQSRPRRRRGRSWLVVLAVLVGVGGWSWGVREHGARVEAPAAVTAATSPLDRAGPGAGDGQGYTFLSLRPDGSGPVTFDGCDPVPYVVRPQGAPPSGAAAIAHAFSELSAATGLEFVDEGLTDEAPDEDRHLSAADLRRPPPVLVAWATEREWPALEGPVAGEAGPVTVTPVGSSDPYYVSGQVVLDADDLSHAPGDARGAAAVSVVVLHELGHLAGLGHVDDQAQLMYPEAHGMSAFGPGDLAGLRVLGSGPCR